MMDAAAASVLPLKRYAEFRGRSTRTEMLAFYVLVLMVTVAIGFSSVAIGVEAQQRVMTGLTLFLVCPSAALAMRQLHDTGRNGWWLLLAGPWAIATGWEFFARPGPWAMRVHLAFPWWVDVPLGLCGATLTILLLLDDDAETNRFGPNPRYGLMGEPA
jgi:uncharacterized membrane protein YhaH (DUF805 family)